MLIPVSISLGEYPKYAWTILIGVIHELVGDTNVKISNDTTKFLMDFLLTVMNCNDYFESEISLDEISLVCRKFDETLEYVVNRKGLAVESCSSIFETTIVQLAEIKKEYEQPLVNVSLCVNCNEDEIRDVLSEILGRIFCDIRTQEIPEKVIDFFNAYLDTSKKGGTDWFSFSVREKDISFVLENLERCLELAKDARVIPRYCAIEDDLNNLYKGFQEAKNKAEASVKI